MPWRGPSYEGEFPSLGWALIDLWSDLFPSPRDSSEPLVLTDDQALTVVRWYGLHPTTGKFIFRRGCSRRSKGTGKSPIEAAKCISELALPVVFDGWDAAGEPVGRPWGTGGLPAPWVQIAALSEEQDENTYSPLYEFLVANDGELADELEIDAGLTRCLLRPAPGRIEPVSSRAGAREGQPVTYGVLDESGLMTRSNGGLGLARTMRRNATKIGGRTYETTNGFMPGEGSVAEATHKAVESGSVGILYDAVEAPTVVDGVEVNAQASDEILKKALAVPYRDAWWVDLDRIVADMRDADMPWSEAERFFLNWNRKGEGRAIDPTQWAELSDPAREVSDGERIGVGFDGSIRLDATVLVGCTVDRHRFLIAAWERPLDATADWRVPRLDVAEAVRDTFERYDVGLMLCDPAKWWSEIETWQLEWGDRVLALDTNSTRRFAPACDRFSTAIADQIGSHDGSEILTRHVLNMARKPLRVGDAADDERAKFVFVKADTGKIDAGIAATLAEEAVATMPEGTGVPDIAGDVDPARFAAELAAIEEDERAALVDLDA